MERRWRDSVRPEHIRRASSCRGWGRPSQRGDGTRRRRGARITPLALVSARRAAFSLSLKPAGRRGPSVHDLSRFPRRRTANEPDVLGQSRGLQRRASSLRETRIPSWLAGSKPPQPRSTINRSLSWTELLGTPRFREGNSPPRRTADWPTCREAGPNVRVWSGTREPASVWMRWATPTTLST